MDILLSSITDSLRRAHLRRLRSVSRLRVEVGAESHAVTRIWDGGFAIEAKGLHKLRGLVDLYEGQTLVRHCLVIATESEDGELICEYKSFTLAGAVPVDYELDRVQPAALLGYQG